MTDNQELWSIPELSNLNEDGSPSMTEQDVFNMSARHILKTGVPSKNANGGCIYSGSGCGASPFLKKGWRTDADGLVTSTGASWYRLADTGRVSKNHGKLISLLQGCHDGAARQNRNINTSFMELWKFAMIELADKYNLSTAVFDEEVV